MCFRKKHGKDRNMEHTVICIGRIDKMRRQYFDTYSASGWGKPESYDLLLSSSRFGVEKCVDVIASAFTMMKGDHSHE